MILYLYAVFNSKNHYNHPVRKSIWTWASKLSFLNCLYQKFNSIKFRNFDNEQYSSLSAVLSNAAGCGCSEGQDYRGRQPAWSSRVSLSGLITGVGSHEGLSCSEPERATSANPKGHKPPQTDTVHTLASAHSLHVCFPVSLVRMSSSGQGLGPCPPQNPCTGPTGTQRTHVKQ